MKYRILFLAFSLVGSLWAEADITKPVLTQQDILKIQERFSTNIKKYVLDNGIRIVLMKNTLSPTIACYLKIGVGSADEPFDIPGAAHFLEHLLFKGTPNIGTNNYILEKVYLKEIEVIGERIDTLERKLLNPLISDQERKEYRNQIDKNKSLLNVIEEKSQVFRIPEEDAKIYSLAGEVGYNAYTNTDVTNYQIQLPKNKLELWAWMESDRFLNPIFRGFYSEREVIQEERRMRLDNNAHGLLYELYVSTAFGTSPYGKPVIGYENNIPRLKQSDIRKFYNENYIPSRMVISIVGDIDFDESFSILKKYFEKIPTKPTPQFPPISIQNQNVKKTAILYKDSNPNLITGWHKPSIYDKDTIVFEVIDRLLTAGQDSRLYKRLVKEEKLASNVGADPNTPGEKLSNTYAIFASAFQEKDYSRITEVIYDEIHKLKTVGPTQDELDKIKYQYYAELINSLDSNDNLADILSFYEVLVNDHQYFIKALETMQAVTVADITRVLTTYFVEEKNTTVWIQKPSTK